MIDFTQCGIIPGRAYNGANGSKIAVSYNGTVYMLKLPEDQLNCHTQTAVSANTSPAASLT